MPSPASSLLSVRRVGVADADYFDAFDRRHGADQIAPRPPVPITATPRAESVAASVLGPLPPPPTDDRPP